jgi:hypothetical protein
MIFLMPFSGFIDNLKYSQIIMLSFFSITKIKLINKVINEGVVKHRCGRRKSLLQDELKILNHPFHLESRAVPVLVMISLAALNLLKD